MTIYHTASDRTPYTYLIGWSQHNKYYYGVRYAKNCHPTDLWKTYFTSSKHVKNFRKAFGEPDIIQIRKTFTTKEAAGLWEHKVLTKLDVLTNDLWLNKSNTKIHDRTGTKHSFVTKNKMKENRKNRIWSDEIKEKIRSSNLGKKRSEATKENIRIARSKQIITEETKKKMSESKMGVKNSMYGKKRNVSLETRQKIKNAFAKRRELKMVQLSQGVL